MAFSRNYSCKKAPLQMFDWILNKPLIQPFFLQSTPFFCLSGVVFVFRQMACRQLLMLFWFFPLEALVPDWWEKKRNKKTLRTWWYFFHQHFSSLRSESMFFSGFFVSFVSHCQFLVNGLKGSFYLSSSELDTIYRYLQFSPKDCSNILHKFTKSLGINGFRLAEKPITFLETII